MIVKGWQDSSKVYFLLQTWSQVFAQLLTMNSRQQKPWSLGPHSRNTLGATQAPSFEFRAPYSSISRGPEIGKPRITAQSPLSDFVFRVPSPTESEEEEIATLEDSLPKYNSGLGDWDSPSNNSDHLSRLEDSSSLFGTPSSAAFTFRSPAPSIDMVVEREPPKAPLSPRKDNQQLSLPPMKRVQQQPEFEKTSPLQNRLKSDNVFNIPKPHKAHSGWHRTTQSMFQNPNVNKPSYVMTEGSHDRPSYPISQVSKSTYALQANEDVVEISRLSNYTSEATYVMPFVLFSSCRTWPEWCSPKSHLLRFDISSESDITDSTSTGTRSLHLSSLHVLRPISPR